jgi:hypothetical protein
MSKAKPGSFGARPCFALRARYMAAGIDALPKSWRKSWMIARIVATPPWFDAGRVRAIYEAAARLTRITGEKHVVDHVVPLQHPLVCGLHYHGNLRVVREKRNAAKSNTFYVDQSELPL